MQTKTTRRPHLLNRSTDALLLNAQALIVTRRRRNRDRHRVTAIADRSDATLYACDCGSLFAAPATTHPMCPSCGHDQSW